MSLDSLALRTALGQYATGVTVVTTLDAEGRPVGLTVNSFASVSLDPPLVLWSLAASSACMQAFKSCAHFAVNVLAVDQVEVSNHFALAGYDKFAEVVWTPGLGGVPLLDDCCARFECGSHSYHSGGDHTIFIGRIERFERFERPPLVFHGGRYCARGESLP